MRLTVCGIGVWCALLCSLVQADNLMKVGGGVVVGKDGQATYTIPINIPTLPDEVSFSIALTYNSHAPVGDAGRGWGIAGFSAITRCPRNVAQDGVSDPQLESMDPAYCLDGRRLVVGEAVNATSRVYKDEFEKFARITAGVTSPAFFKVTTKSGSVLTYTALADTIEGKRWYWPLTQIQDIHGSYVTVDYQLYAGGLRPLSIKKGIIGGELPEVLAKFNYIYIAAAQPTAPVLVATANYRTSYLGSIDVFKIPSRSARLKEYKLTYDLDPATRLPNLKIFRECATNCLPPVNFTYASEQPRFIAPFESTVLDWGRKEGRDWVDVNGDGRADFCRIVGPDGVSRAVCTLSVGNGFGGTFTSDVLNAGIDGSQKWVDVNADGFADFCRVTGTPGAYSLDCTFGSAAGFGSTVSSTVDAGTEMQNAKWHDIRNDGKMRYCRYDSTSKFRCAVLSGNAFVEESGLVGTGTGKFDLVNLVSKALPYRCARLPLKFTCFALDSAAQFDMTINGNPGWWVDLNGDGHTDYCQVNGFGTLTMQCGRATGLKTAVQAQGTLESLDTIRGLNVVAGLTANAKWVDVNGDKTADYCRIVGAPGSYKAACSLYDGPSFRSAIESDLLDAGLDSGQGWVDVVGDGGKAFCRLIGSANLVDSKVACTPTAAPGGQLTQIDNGIGASTKLTYKPLTDSAVYTKGTSAIYPTVDVQEPTYVVSTLDQGNGRGGYVSTGYQYGGAMRDVSGRGGLGMRWTTATKLASGLVTRSVYRQDIPFAGLPIQTTVSLAGHGNAGLLSEVTNEYGCNDFVSASGCVVARGAHYFPYLMSTVSKSWDLNGAPMPTITTTQEFDNWGNVTRSKRTASDGITVETVNTYKPTNNVGRLPGLVEKTVVTKSAPAN